MFSRSSVVDERNGKEKYQDITSRAKPSHSWTVLFSAVAVAACLNSYIIKKQYFKWSIADCAVSHR